MRRRRQGMSLTAYSNTVRPEPCCGGRGAIPHRPSQRPSRNRARRTDAAPQHGGQPGAVLDRDSTANDVRPMPPTARAANLALLEAAASSRNFSLFVTPEGVARYVGIKT